MATEVVRLTDPVCGMSVRLDAAAQEGLAVDHDGTQYVFCRAECLAAFRADPQRYAHSAPAAAASRNAGRPLIDEGMRRWYDSCSCCLGDAYPEVKAALDEERRTLAQPPAGEGICEVAEAGQG